jgi:hypothetical protein
MTLNKYNEYMSHIEVTDEMKARVLANVSKAIAEQKTEDGTKADVTPMPVARKKKPVPIAAIISIAASVLIVGGIAIAFLSNAMSTTSHDSSKSAKPDTAAQTEAYDGGAEAAGEAVVDEFCDSDADAGTDSYGGYDEGEDWEAEETTAATENVTTVDTRPVKGPESYAPDEDIMSLIPAGGEGSVETSMSVENGTSIITFNAASNSGTLYIADEGVDLASTYLNGVTVNASNSTTGVTGGGISYALVNTKTADVSNFNAAVFEEDGKSYLIVFDSPVPEESIRTVIEDY